jgi:hypothetical protein
MNLKTILGMLLIGAVLYGSTNDGPVTITSTGSVPFIVSFNSTGSGEDATDDLTETAGNFATVNDDDYDRTTDDVTTNYFAIDDILVCNDFDANHLVVVKLLKGGWTLPANYAGLKLTDATEATELLVKVNVTAPGYSSDASEGLVTSSTFGSQYTGLAATATEVMTGGLAAHGVEDAAFDVDARVLFDWLTDIPGTYTVALTISVEEGS